MNDIPLSLYVHFPWCVRKCPYCDFNSHELRAGGAIPEDRYIDTLVRDLASERASAERRDLVSIFLGGGTPSLFTPAAIGRLLAAVARHFDVEDTEITLEANPGTFDQAHFDGYRAAGVNRLSIGAQSFSAACLRALGRIHKPADITRAFDGAVRAGFSRINLDLMHGLPGQDEAMALADIDSAVSLGPEHISWYQLTLEPNTAFYSKPPVLPSDDRLDAIAALGADALNATGYQQYEVSAYARRGGQCRHNLNYWQFGDYLGIGAGAHGKRTTRQGAIFRTTKSRAPKDYMRDPSPRLTRVRHDEKKVEFLMNALRLNRGFDYDLFESRTGLPRETLRPFAEAALARGFIRGNIHDGMAPSRRGQLFLTDMLLLLD